MGTAQTSKIREKDLIDSIAELNRAGMAAANAGRFEEAETKMMVALARARSLGQGQLSAKILNSIGILYAMKGIWDHALLCYDKALSITAGEIGQDNYLFTTIQKNILNLLVTSRK